MTIKNTNKKVSIEGSLPFQIFKEGKAFVAYSQALDISTSGKSIEEVRKRFQEVAEIFFEEVYKNGTLNIVLAELGWSFKSNYWHPPVLISHGLLELDNSFSTTKK